MEELTDIIPIHGQSGQIRRNITWAVVKLILRPQGQARYQLHILKLILMCHANLGIFEKKYSFITNS